MDKYCSMYVWNNKTVVLHNQRFFAVVLDNVLGDFPSLDDFWNNKIAELEKIEYNAMCCLSSRLFRAILCLPENYTMNVECSVGIRFFGRNFEYNVENIGNSTNYFRVSFDVNLMLMILKYLKGKEYAISFGYNTPIRITSEGNNGYLAQKIDV